MNTKILALTILIISSVSAQSTNLVYNSTSCAATTARTSAFCLTAQGSNNLTLPVCATVNFTGNVSNRIVTGNVGYYCLPWALTGNGDIAFNSTHNVTVTATSANNAATWATAASQIVNCNTYGDQACATNTCCASRQFTVASTTMVGNNQCIANSNANTTGVASFATNTISLSNITWVTNCLPIPANNGSGNGTDDSDKGNAALIKYSIGAVASLVALTFF